MPSNTDCDSAPPLSPTSIADVESSQAELNSVNISESALSDDRFRSERENCLLSQREGLYMFTTGRESGRDGSYPSVHVSYNSSKILTHACTPCDTSAHDLCSSDTIQSLTLVRDFLISLSSDGSDAVNTSKLTLESFSSSLPFPDSASQSGSLVDDLIQAIIDNEQLDVEIEALRDSLIKQTQILHDLQRSQPSLPAHTVQDIESRTNIAETRNNELRFHLEHVLGPELDQLLLEKSSAEAISSNLSKTIGIQKTQLEVLRSQLNDRNQSIRDLEQSIHETESQIEALKCRQLPQVVVPSPLGPSSIAEDIAKAVKKAESAYSESAMRLRKLQTEIDRLQRTISVKTENVLKPILDRIVSAEIEAERLRGETEIISHELEKLRAIGRTIDKRCVQQEGEKVELEKMLEETHNQWKGLCVDKAELETDLERRVNECEAANRSLMEEKTNYQKCMHERKNFLHQVGARVNQLKTNIVEISSMKELFARNSERRGKLSAYLCQLVEEKSTLDIQIAKIEEEISTLSKKLEELLNCLSLKKLKLFHREESVCRSRIQVQSSRRDLDLAKLEIAKYRGIGTRLTEAKCELEILVAQRKQLEELLEVKIASHNSTPNIGEVFALTTDSVAARIGVTETRIAKARERCIDLTNFIRELDFRETELNEKIRGNIELMKKISRFKIIFMHANRQYCARQAEQSAFTKAIEELEKQCEELKSEIEKPRDIFSTKIRKLKQRTKKSNEESSDDDSHENWLGVPVR